MKALITSGGKGTRLRPLTNTQNKHLIPIANKPVLFYAIEDLKEAGVTEIGLILGTNMPEKVQEAVGDGSQFGVKITYIMQGEPKGLAHAVAVAKDVVGEESFNMDLEDNILKSGIKEFVEGFEESKYQARILLQQVENPRQFGVAELDGEGHVINLVEKPKPTSAPSDLAIVGKYIITPHLLKSLQKAKPGKKDKELRLIDGMREFIKHSPIHGYEVKGKRFDTGDKLGYLKSVVHFALKHKKISDDFKNYLKTLDLK